MLKTWSIIDIPPKPIKKAVIIILIPKFELAIELTAVTPFVSSIIPVMIGIIKSDFILINLKNGDNNINTKLKK